jgi:hypothetical protein
MEGQVQALFQGKGFTGDPSLFPQDQDPGILGVLRTLAGNNPGGFKVLVGAQSGGGGPANMLAMGITQGLPDDVAGRWGVQDGQKLANFNPDNLVLGKVNTVGSEYLAGNIGANTQYLDAQGLGTQVTLITGDQALEYQDPVAYIGGKQYGTTVYLDQTYAGQAGYSAGSVLGWFHRMEGALAEWNQSNGDINTLPVIDYTPLPMTTLNTIFKLFDGVEFSDNTAAYPGLAAISLFATAFSAPGESAQFFGKQVAALFGDGRLEGVGTVVGGFLELATKYLAFTNPAAFVTKLATLLFGSKVANAVLGDNDPIATWEATLPPAEVGGSRQVVGDASFGMVAVYKYDDRSIYVTPDGTSQTLFNDGAYQVRYAGGGQLTMNPDGNGAIRFSVGSVAVNVPVSPDQGVVYKPAVDAGGQQVAGPGSFEIVSSSADGASQVKSINLANGETTVKDFAVGGSVRSSTYNLEGILLSSAQITYFDNGSSTETTYYPDGRTIRTNTDGDGNISSRANIQYFEEDGSSIETVSYADGRIVKLSYDGDGNLLSQQEIESGGQTLQNAIGQYGGTILDALSLVKAIQSGEPLPILASGLRLANDLSNLNGITNYNLSGAANVASGILSLLSLDAALERGDTLGAVTAGVQALSFGATAYTEFLIAQNGGDAIGALVENTDAFGFAEGLGDALPYLSLINSIANGDVAGTAVAALSIVGVPYLGWAYAVYSIIDSLFGGDDEEIPDPWGNGHFTWNGSGISYQSVGETGGNEAVANVMGSVLSTMNALIERERQQNPGSALGIIPNRMPGVGYDMSGYRYTDIDPLTGAEQHPALRFDTAGRPYNAAAGSPESWQSIVEGMVRSALARGALAPLWEVATAKLQTDAGDPKAGLTEEERAGRDGQLAAPITGSTQTFRPVALDLDGDGLETTTRADGVAFDVDDSGYLKATGWVQGDDAFLTLDRDVNGQFDSGRELFSNGTVALGRRGLAGLNWVDSNYDGKLTAADPVWSELKVWRDLDQDGAQDAGEVQGLDALGVSELNYAMGTFTQAGQQKQLASPDLDADRDGTRVSVVPEGILVQASADGRLSLLVTRIDDRTAVEANRDGITGYEDVELIVSGADLLANDTLGGFLGRDLALTGLTNLRHGTGFVDANGFVRFTPEANYAGSDAGGDYGAANSAAWRMAA